jgi:hypothetical protein
LPRNDDSRTAFEDHQRHHWHMLPIFSERHSKKRKLSYCTLIDSKLPVGQLLWYGDGFVVGRGGFLSSSSQWFTQC